MKILEKKPTKCHIILFNSNMYGVPFFYEQKIYLLFFTMICFNRKSLLFSKENKNSDDIVTFLIFLYRTLLFLRIFMRRK